MRQPDRIPGQMAASSIDAFLAFREEMDVCWDEPPLSRLRQMMPPTPPTAAADAPRFSWDDIDDGPAEDDPSWAAFDEAAEARDGANGSGPSSSRPDRRRLTKAQREKRDKEEQMAESRESIRRRGWSENEVKWRSWLARRGHDVQVNQWNLHEYVDGECTPPSRDPFWLSANEKPLPDYEAGNDGQDEDAPPLMTNLMSEVIKPKYPQKRIVELKPLWADVDGEKLARETLGRKAHDYYWRQSTSMIYLEFKLPEGTSARELTVEMHPTHLTVRVGDQPPLIDEELYMRIYVGSNADNDSSVWEIHDKRVLIFHLVKWHRLAAGNVRDVSRTWWRKCLVREVEFENTVPASSYYEQKD